MNQQPLALSCGRNGCTGEITFPVWEPWHSIGDLFPCPVCGHVYELMFDDDDWSGYFWLDSEPRQ